MKGAKRSGYLQDYSRQAKDGELSPWNLHLRKAIYEGDLDAAKRLSQIPKDKRGGGNLEEWGKSEYNAYECDALTLATEVERHGGSDSQKIREMISKALLSEMVSDAYGNSKPSSPKAEKGSYTRLVDKTMRSHFPGRSGGGRAS